VSPPKDWLLPSADTIAIYYYYSARKLILILPSHGGWKAEFKWCRSVSLCVCPLKNIHYYHHQTKYIQWPK